MGGVGTCWQAEKNEGVGRIKLPHIRESALAMNAAFIVFKDKRSRITFEIQASEQLGFFTMK